MHGAKLAIIGGTGLEGLLREGQTTRVGTPYGPSPPIVVGAAHGRTVAFLPRHGLKHEIPPHRVNYRANLWALKELGVERIFGTNAVGAINESMRPGDLVLPHDVIDLTKTRAPTFYDATPVTHIDVTEPYCPQLRRALADASSTSSRKVWSEGVLAATEGPRYETPAEIRMLRTLGCDVVGMTGAPEAFLARELEICYAPICFVSNMAAGMQRALTAKEVTDSGRESAQDIRRVIEKALERVPEARSCPCSKALEAARA